MTDADPASTDELIRALADLEPAAAANPDAIRISRAPGRVNLIGEHTDYNLGLVLPAAIDREIRIAAFPADDGIVDLTRLATGDRRRLDLSATRQADGSWMDYVAGTAWALAEAGMRPTGIRGVIASDLPEGAGLSSSAAIELAAAWSLIADPGAVGDGLALARICQRAENEYVGVMSGLMDQFAASCGVQDHAMLLDCRSHAWHAVPLPDTVRLVVLHSGSERSLGRSAYNERRAQCQAAVTALAVADPSVRSLRDVSKALLAEERHRLDPVIARRAEHVVAENARVVDAVAALESGDLAAVGELFAASHRSLRDLYEVSSPELDALVEVALAVDGVVAARMTGAGFGGCTVNLVRPDAVDALRDAVLTEYPARTGYTPKVIPVRAAAGAGLVEASDGGVERSLGWVAG